MSTTNSPTSLMTKSAIWSILCDAAHCKSAGGGRGQICSPTIPDTEMDVDAVALMDIFGPLLGQLPDDRPLVIGHLAQSLDGCIAQADGESHWISGEADLDHTHRLRAICDVVLVGAETVARDDCQLSVRRVPGPHPVRVVLDPQARLTGDRKIFQTDGGKTLWVIGKTTKPASAPHEQVEIVELESREGQFDLVSLMSVLHQSGYRRVFVEGGGVTISHFLRSGLLDRLHIAVAPILIGGGRPTIGRALGDTLSDCPRPSVQIHPMGPDWLFDCDFRQSLT